jgi:chromosome partitioning protein
MLSDVGEFVKQLVKLFQVAPPEAIAVVVVGAIAAGGLAGWFAARALARRRMVGVPEPVTPKPTGEEAVKLAHVLRVEREFLADETGEKVWSIHKPKVPTEALKRLRQSHMKTVVFLNQKGGVAKTTLTVNMAGFFASRGKRVLVIDLDYQGSASTTLIRASGMQPPSSAPMADVLAGRSEDAIKRIVSLSHNLQLIDVLVANDSISNAETRAQFLWLLDPQPAHDVRARLAETMATEAFLSRGYDVVLVDTPPRFTLGVYNALVPATYFVVPTIGDALSIGNIDGLMIQVKKLVCTEFNPGLELAGIIPTLTESDELKPDEELNITQAVRAAQDKWRHDAYRFRNHLPDGTDIAKAAGSEIAVLLTKRADQRAAGAFFEKIGVELASRIGVKV